MFIYYIIATLSVLLYLHGFFPIPARPTKLVPSNNVTSAQPQFQRAVLIVIDALRLDFITNSETPFLASTYKKTGCFIHIKVETPTVTLPRIKALTTGNVPQFVDIILNLASPTKVEDSFIHRAHASGKKIVFYGDDIWTKLFPEVFLRSEGTSSFFVNDFTEVDDNVTRNVRFEKRRKDWDIMILHYLGLDHIGHVYGPKSPLIFDKLKEMDSIIEEIHKTNEDILFLITGDHGMRDSGGHGGSTFPETNVPLLILGMSCQNDTFPQIDIPANVAILLGFDIPSTSIGQLQDSLLRKLPETEYLRALQYNTLLLRTKVDLCEEKMQTADHFLELFLMNKDNTLRDNAVRMYKKCAKDISEKLQKTVQQNLASLAAATVTALVVLTKILQDFCTLKKSWFEQVFMLATLVFQFWDFQYKYGSFVVVSLAVMNLARNLAGFDYKHLKSVDLSYLTVLSVLHPFIFLSSSFLEEEHQYWYFFTNTFIVLNVFRSKEWTFEWVLLSVAVRFVRTINQVGDKWAAVPDLADWLLKQENALFLQVIFITGLFLVFYGNRAFSRTKISRCLDGVIFILIYTFRTVGKEYYLIGQAIWILIFLKLLISFQKKEGFLPIWVLTITLLLKPYNVILIPVSIFASQLFHKTLKSHNLVMSHWWLGNLLFFAQGHDNSLASVDISSGYIGLQEYHPLLVFPQVLSHTYALPVLSHLLLFTSKHVNIHKTFSIFVLFRLYIVTFVFLVTFLQRHHLFIWSVFAPKMFVEASHFGFLFIEISCYYIRALIKK